MAAVLFLLILGGGGYALHRSGRLTPIMANLGVSDVVGSTLRDITGVTGQSAPTAAKSSGGARASQGGQGGQGGLNQSPFQVSGMSPAEVDSSLQKAPLWRIIKTEFPDWYADRVKDTAARLAGEQKDEKGVPQYLAEAMVSLRRQHVNDALSASPPRLREVASTFLDNLGRLSNHSVEACYVFISRGETSPQIVELMRESDYAPRLQHQVVSVFEAIAEGRKAPRASSAPRREDYDALAAQLAQRGWSPADLQLFSDARQLSRAPPQKVCQMVQDWFAAQLAIKDEEVQMRLLVEALKPVVSG